MTKHVHGNSRPEHEEAPDEAPVLPPDDPNLPEVEREPSIDPPPTDPPIEVPPLSEPPRPRRATGAALSSSSTL
jgi:hypothetical protein